MRIVCPQEWGCGAGREWGCGAGQEWGCGAGGGKSATDGLRIEAEDIGSGMTLRDQEQWELIKRISTNSQKVTRRGGSRL